MDVSVDTLPVGIASVQTSGAFSHNTWLSENNKYLFTTDEINNSFLACYNIEDLQNIELIDKIQSNPGSYSVVHNTYIYESKKRGKDIIFGTIHPILVKYISILIMFNLASFSIYIFSGRCPF